MLSWPAPFKSSSVQQFTLEPVPSEKSSIKIGSFLSRRKPNIKNRADEMTEAAR